MSPLKMHFPDGFTWGAASSSYQIEGAAAAGGKGESIWDAFCRRPGAVHAGSTCEVASDHFSRRRDVVRRIGELGLRAYRFSVSWPRVMPTGVGSVSEEGLGFYDRLVDGLLEAGIEPWLTLFHWDYPSDLQRRGGWLNPDSPGWFARYTRAVVDRLSDRVSNWITINEPQIFIGLGHGQGIHAPGLKLGLADQLLATHHALLAHGLAAVEIRSHAKLTPRLGWAPCGCVEYPAVETAANIEASRRSMMSVRRADTWNNTWYADAVCLGAYPEDGLRLFGAAAPRVGPGEMRTINQPLDFYGLNIYSGEPQVAGPDGDAVAAPFKPGHPQTGMKWYVAPESLRWGPRFIYERYGVPIVITENGMSNLDWPEAPAAGAPALSDEIAGSGPRRRVRDPQRIEYTRAYLRALHAATLDGVDVRGYFHWSIMDNFEWAEGYSQRFGLIYVDFATGERIPKDSAYWYRGVIESNGRSLADAAADDPGAAERQAPALPPGAPVESTPSRVTTPRRPVRHA